MANWKLRKDKTPAETLDAAEAPGAEIPQTEAFNPEALNPEAAMNLEAPDREFGTSVQAYDLGEPEETNFVSLDSMRHFSSFDSEPEARFTDLDFDSDPEDPSAASPSEHPGKYPEHGDGPLTLVDYTEPEAVPTGFILQGAQIFAMPPPEVEAPAAIEMLPPVEMSGAIEMLLPAVEAPPPPIIEAVPSVQTEDAPEEDFPERLRTGRFDRSELAPAPAPHFGIPTVSPFVLDTPVPQAPPAAPPQLVVHVGRLSAPFALAKDVTTIGRPDSGLHSYPDVEIELDDAVSRRHAEIVRRGDSYYLVDTGSTNGTLLNGERLPPQEERLLAYGDRIRVGDRTEITFE